MTVAPPEAIDIDSTGLQARWPDRTVSLTAAQLRAACRCGGCRADRAAGRAVAVDGAELAGAEAVGAYAVQLIFRDGHDRGIYPWALLSELAGPAHGVG